MPLFDSAYNFAHFLVQSQNDAEDLVQQSYLKGLRISELARSSVVAGEESIPQFSYLFTLWMRSP
jgi:DNA-directed RNA polymerase specialized sigma24 family protein